MGLLAAVWLLHPLAIRADTIEAANLGSPRFTIVTRRGGRECRFRARIWGVENFSKEYLEAESRAREVAEQANREEEQRTGHRIYRDGAVGPWILVNLGWVISKQPVDLTLRGVDPDGTLAVDVATKPLFGYDWVSTTMVAVGQWRARPTDLVRDAALRAADEGARLNRAGYWRFETIPPTAPRKGR